MCQSCKLLHWIMHISRHWHDNACMHALAKSCSLAAVNPCPVTFACMAASLSPSWGQQTPASLTTCRLRSPAHCNQLTSLQEAAWWMPQAKCAQPPNHACRGHRRDVIGQPMQQAQYWYQEAAHSQLTAHAGSGGSLVRSREGAPPVWSAARTAHPARSPGTLCRDACARAAPGSAARSRPAPSAAGRRPRLTRHVSHKLRNVHVHFSKTKPQLALCVTLRF